MKGKRKSIEEKVRILRQADGNQTIQQVCDEHNISEQTFHRWKNELGLLDVKQAKRLKELEAGRGPGLCIAGSLSATGYENIWANLRS